MLNAMASTQRLADALIHCGRCWCSRKLTGKWMPTSEDSIPTSRTGAHCFNHCYGYLHQGAEGRLLKSFSCSMMPSGTRTIPSNAGGEGWLVNDQQEKVVCFKNDKSTAHAEWVTLAP